jgi:hypothetical protein
MARFIGRIQGARGAASRLGGDASGITAEANGWNVGVTVRGRAVPAGDVFDIYATGGTNGAAPEQHLGWVSLDADGKVEFVPTPKPPPETVGEIVEAIEAGALTMEDALASLRKPL